jgi:hypothetical protein
MRSTTLLRHSGRRDCPNHHHLAPINSVNSVRKSTKPNRNGRRTKRSASVRSKISRNRGYLKISRRRGAVVEIRYPDDLARLIVGVHCSAMTYDEKTALTDAIIAAIIEYGEVRYDDGFQTGYDSAHDEHERASS